MKNKSWNLAPPAVAAAARSKRSSTNKRLAQRGGRVPRRSPPNRTSSHQSSSSSISSADSMSSFLSNGSQKSANTNSSKMTNGNAAWNETYMQDLSSVIKNSNDVSTKARKRNSCNSMQSATSLPLSSATAEALALFMSSSLDEKNLQQQHHHQQPTMIHEYGPNNNYNFVSPRQQVQNALKSILVEDLQEQQKQ